MKTAVLFFAHSYPTGLVYHLAHLACALVETHKYGLYEIYVCSEAQEQYAGAWTMLRANVDPRHVIAFENYHDDITTKVEKLLGCHDRLLIHFGGGIHQLKPLIPIREKYAGRVKLLATTHAFKMGTWKRFPASLLQFACYQKHVDHVVFQTPYTARNFFGGNWLLRHGGASIIPLGVEPFTQDELQNVPNEPLGEPDLRSLLPDQTFFNVVYLATFKPGKGHLWLVKALAPLLRQNPRIRIVMPGDGALLNKTRRRVSQLQLGKQVVCPGRMQRRHIPWILAQHQLALVASRGETFGHCFLEPAFAGLPVLGTRVGVGEYLIQDMQTGMGFQYGDAKGLQSGVQFFVNHLDEARAMGMEFKQRVGHSFSHVEIARAHHRLYVRLLA